MSLVLDSLRFDVRLLRINSLALTWKVGFLGKKYIALASLLRGKSASIVLGSLRMTFSDVSGLGTFQSNIVDVFNEIVQTELITRRDPFVIDVGANIGQFTNAIKLFFPAARVIAFEPDPDVFAALERNTARLGGVAMHNFALGGTTSTLPFHRHRLSTMSSFSPLDNSEDLVDVLNVPVRRLDDVLGDTDQPDLVKVDAEASEVEVLAGATATLQRAAFLVVEVSLGTTSGRYNLEVFEVIRRACPEAHILRYGRQLGDPKRPQCQDVVLALRA
jgi:FkbM family methyltransferase